MKKIKLLALALLISAAAVANTGDYSKKIKSTISIPESLKEHAVKKGKTEKVTIHFVVNESGQVIEVNAVTPDAEAKKDLENQFLKLSFTGMEACVLHCVDLSFVVY